jgi:prophage regulatory protein
MSRIFTRPTSNVPSPLLPLPLLRRDEAMALLSVNDVLAYLKMSRTALYKQLRLGAFPRPMKVGGNRLRWRRAAIEAYLTEQAARAEQERGARC